MRVRLYHHTEPEGKIFTTYDEMRDAEESGWVDAAWKVAESKEDIIAKDVPKKLCACGCGKEVEDGKKWVKGHQFRGAKK